MSNFWGALHKMGASAKESPFQASARHIALPLVCIFFKIDCVSGAELAAAPGLIVQGAGLYQEVPALLHSALSPILPPPN